MKKSELKRLIREEIQKVLTNSQPQNKQLNEITATSPGGLKYNLGPTPSFTPDQREFIRKSISVGFGGSEPNPRVNKMMNLSDDRLWVVILENLWRITHHMGPMQDGMEFN